MTECVRRGPLLPARAGMAGAGAWRAAFPLGLALGRRVRAAAGAVPPTGTVLLGIASAQLGSAVAKQLFAALPPAAVVLLRLGFATVALLPAAARSGLRRAGVSGLRWRDAAVAAALGVAVAGMNLAFYESLDRIPLGVAVTVEFVGPLGVAVAGSRRRIDLLWVVLAGSGVVLLSRVGGEVTATGVAFAALAGVGWATYILLTAAVGRRFGDTSGLALATAAGTAAVLPFGVATAGADLLSPRLLLVGAAVALLSTVVPWSLELRTLRRIPPRVFGLLMSLEPAAAALIGLVVLGEVLGVREWVALVLVVAACVGVTRSQHTGS